MRRRSLLAEAGARMESRTMTVSVCCSFPCGCGGSKSRSSCSTVGASRVLPAKTAGPTCSGRPLRLVVSLCRGTIPRPFTSLTREDSPPFRVATSEFGCRLSAVRCLPQGYLSLACEGCQPQLAVGVIWCKPSTSWILPQVCQVLPAKASGSTCVDFL